MTGQDVFENPAEVSGGTETPVTEPTSTPSTESSDGTPTKPEGLPDKFWDAEKGEVRVDDLTKSYSELEGKFRAGEHKKDEAGKPDDLKIEPVDDPAALAVSAAGLDMDALAAEYTENGNALKPESMAKLAETDFVKQTAEAMGTDPSELVQSYLAGQKALADSYSADLKAAAGGEESYGNMVQWAANGGLDAASIEAFNRAIDGNDPAVAKLAIEGLHAKYQATNPSKDPSTTVKGGSIPAQGMGFRDVTEMYAAQRDPRYGKTNAEGIAYMKEFEQRMAATSGW